MRFVKALHFNVSWAMSLLLQSYQVLQQHSSGVNFLHFCTEFVLEQLEQLAQVDQAESMWIFCSLFQFYGKLLLQKFERLLLLLNTASQQCCNRKHLKFVLHCALIFWVFFLMFQHEISYKSPGTCLGMLQPGSSQRGHEDKREKNMQSQKSLVMQSAFSDI